MTGLFGFWRMETWDGYLQVDAEATSLNSKFWLVCTVTQLVLRQTDGGTDRRTDRQTDGQTEPERNRLDREKETDRQTDE